METWNTIVEQLGIFRDKIIHIMANISGRTEPKAEMILLIILGYIVVLLFLLFIHRKLIKRHKRIHEHSIFLYDTIRYQVAKAQYSNPSIQESKGIKVVMESEQENYLANTKAIREEIMNIEQHVGQKIIGDDQRDTISRQTKKKNTAKAFMEIIGRLTTLITAGVYKLFW
jgi:hypothetical protein